MWSEKDRPLNHGQGRRKIDRNRLGMNNCTLKHRNILSLSLLSYYSSENVVCHLFASQLRLRKQFIMQKLGWASVTFSYKFSHYLKYFLPVFFFCMKQWGFSFQRILWILLQNRVFDPMVHKWRNVIFHRNYKKNEWNVLRILKSY